MRIISGSRRGRKLLGFDGDYIRPTTDRVKESMFNLIQNHLSGAMVFDAFAGTGALGLEALSRGADFVVCTDIDKRSLEIIKKNYDACSFSDRYDIKHAEAADYLKTSDKQFDIIFMDPPYNKGLVTPVLRIVSDRNLLKTDGIIVIERDGEDDVFELSGFTVIKERKYGRTIITVLGHGE